jgi:hypothetical protein
MQLRNLLLVLVPAHDSRTLYGVNPSALRGREGDTAGPAEHATERQAPLPYDDVDDFVSGVLLRGQRNYERERSE